MIRRNFLQNSLVVMAGTALSQTAMASLPITTKKAFKVKALSTRTPEKIMFKETPIDFKLLSSDTENRLSVFVSSNNKKGFGPPLHVHYTFDEFFCVLEGKFFFHVDNEQHMLNTGDSIFIPRNVKHAFDYEGETSGTLLVAITPGKGIEAFFEDMSKYLNVKGKPDEAAMQRVYEAHNSKIVGPPIGKFL